MAFILEEISEESVISFIICRYIMKWIINSENYLSWLWYYGKVTWLACFLLFHGFVKFMSVCSYLFSWMLLSCQMVTLIICCKNIKAKETCSWIDIHLQIYASFICLLTFCLFSMVPEFSKYAISENLFHSLACNKCIHRT